MASKPAMSLTPGDLARFGDGYWLVETVKPGLLSGTVEVSYWRRGALCSDVLTAMASVPWMDRNEAAELNLGRGA